MGQRAESKRLNCSELMDVYVTHFPSRPGNMCGRGGGKIVRAEVVDDSKEAEFPRHSKADVHMDS